MSGSSGGAAPRTPTRGRILEVSLRLFSAKGYHRTTVRAIAERVGVTEGAFYRHFRSKRQLLEALLEERGLNEAYRTLATVPADMPLERALVGMTLGSLRFMEHNKHVLRVILLESIAGEGTTLEQYREMSQRWVAGVASIIEHKAPSEGIDPAKAERLARQLVSFLWGTFLERLLGSFPLVVLDDQGALTPEAGEYARDAVRRLIQGSQAI